MGPFHPHPLRPPPRIERTEEKAIIALVLGILSMGCAGPIAGVPAIILGSLARRDIDQSSGTRTGRAIAPAGTAPGLFGTCLGFVIMLCVVGAVLAPDSPEDTASLPPTAEPASVATDEPLPPPIPVTPAPAPAGTRSYGSLEVIDLDDTRGLRAQLVEITQRSGGRKIVLQTYAKASAICEAVDAALPDKRMQGALANVTLVRVDVDEYDTELRQMKIETATAPWFYKLDAKGNPTDALSAEAWETDAPENMAPVLRRFIHRAAPRRR